MIGRVASVEQDRQGVTLDGDHAEGATSLTVTEAFDLEPDGGHLSLPSGETVEYGPVDTEGLTVPLVGELPEAVEDAERLEVHPPMVTTVAYVSIDDTDESTPIPVTVRADVAGWSTLAPGASLRFEVTKGGDLVATDVISGTLEVAADQVSNGTIRSEWRMSRDGAIVVGDDEVGSGEFMYDGLRFSKPGPMGLPYENVVMTTEETSFGVMGPDGTRLGGISAEGNVSGVAGSFQEDVTVAGEPLLGTLAEGGDETGWLDRLPRGILAQAERMTPSATIVSTGVQMAHIHVSAALYPGRRYRIVGSVRARLHTSNAALSLFLRHRTGTSKPVVTDPQIGHGTFGTGVSNSANHRLVGYAEALYEVDTPRVESFLLCYRGDYGGTPQRESSWIYIEDVGPAVVDSGGSDEDDPGEDNKVTYTTTWQATASRMYDRFGAMIAGRDGDVDLWYWHGAPVDYQSCGILFAAGAARSTDGAEVGKTLPQALDGAEIQSVDIYLRNKVWYGSPMSFGVNTLGASSLPASRQVNNVGGRVWTQRNYTSGAGAWWPISTGATWFANGSNRGITLGDYRGVVAVGGIDYDLTSAAFHGINDDDPPLLRITYTR